MDDLIRHPSRSIFCKCSQPGNIHSSLKDLSLITEDEYHRARELKLLCFLYSKREEGIPADLSSAYETGGADGNVQTREASDSLFAARSGFINLYSWDFVRLAFATEHHK